MVEVLSLSEKELRILQYAPTDTLITSSDSELQEATGLKKSRLADYLLQLEKKGYLTSPVNRKGRKLTSKGLKAHQFLNKKPLENRITPSKQDFINGALSDTSSDTIGHIGNPHSSFPENPIMSDAMSDAGKYDYSLNPGTLSDLHATNTCRKRDFCGNVFALPTLPYGGAIRKNLDWFLGELGWLKELLLKSNPESSLLPSIEEAIETLALSIFN